MFYPRAFCLLLDYLPILQHLPHELFGIWEQFVFSHLVICSKLFYPSMHALKCLAIYLNEYHTLAITFLNRKKLKTTLAHILFQNTSVDVIHPDVPAL